MFLVLTWNLQFRQAIIGFLFAHIFMKFLLLCLLFLIHGVGTAGCEGDFKSIAEIQGVGDTSPLLDQTVTVRAVVSGVFVDSGELDGFFVQSLQPDNNPNTSEGLFIYTRQWQPAVAVGDEVSVSGLVSEQHGLTQLRAVSHITQCRQHSTLPEASVIELPLDDLNLETLENMRVAVRDAVVTDVYQYLKFGEITVSSERLFSTTSLVAPGPAVEPLAASQRRDQLVVDDGRLQAYARPFAVGHDGQSPVSADNPMRSGYTVSVEGILHYAFGQFKLQPTTSISLKPQSNFRSFQPDRPEGDLTVATFNMENWFTDLNDGRERCGTIIGMGCRGAFSDREQQRQLQKLVAVIQQLDASIIGLQELQNNPRDSLNQLVDALNQAAQKQQWAYVDAGQLGQDVIKVGLIYQPQQVMPVGPYAVLSRDTVADFEDHRNRVVLAQTFQHLASETLLTVASLHLKSKGCRDAQGAEMAQDDGQGCYNPTRTRAARQIVRWMEQDPTGMGAEIRMIVGDFNSYQMEDPIQVFEQGGYVNLAREFLGVENWTTSYRGKVGSLDYIMANNAALAQAAGITQWHINADEIRDFGYRMTPLEGPIQRPDNFYRVSPFSSSDHDPVMAGFYMSKHDDETLSQKKPR